MTWRYTRPTRKTRVPAHVVSVSVLPFAAERSRSRSAYDLTADAWAACYSMRRGGRWRQTVTASGRDCESWWAWLSGLAKCGRTVWVFATQADQCATMLGIWPMTDDGTVTWGRLQRSAGLPSGAAVPAPADRCTMILSSPPTILQHYLASGSVCWVSTSNYVPGSLADLAAAVGMLAPEVWGQGTHASGYAIIPAQGAAVVHTFVTKMIDEWAAGKRGPWRTTASQLSHSWWRQSHHTHPILIHDDPEAHRIERASLAGGRTELYCLARIGSVPVTGFGGSDPPRQTPAPWHAGPLYRLDIRSCYAHLLATMPFPTRLDRVLHEPSIATLTDELSYSAGIATVRIRTEVPRYPVKLPAHRGRRQEWTGLEWASVPTSAPPRTVYPVGEFDCTLAGPELRDALSHGRVLKVHAATIYRQALAFKSLASDGLRLRELSRKSGNAVGELLYKLLLNSFAGKWASRPGGWIADTKIEPPTDWGEFRIVRPGTSEPIRCRSIGGVVQRYEPDPDGIKGFPAILSYLTAYGRSLLWDIMERCPPRTVIQCDTDGLFVLPDAVNALRASGDLGKEAPGRLRIVSQHRCGQFLAARHYWVDGNLTCAGIAGGWTWSGDGQLEDHQYQSRPGGIGGAPDQRVIVTRRLIDVYGIRPLGTYDRLGWLVPMSLPITFAPPPEASHGLPFSS